MGGMGGGMGGMGGMGGGGMGGMGGGGMGGGGMGGGGMGGGMGGMGGGMGGMGGMGGGMGGMDPTMDPTMGGMGGRGGGMGGRTSVLTLQQALNSPDNEWAVLAPKVQRVLDAQQLQPTGLMQGGGYGYGGGYGGGGMGGRGGGGMAGPTNNPVTTALNELSVVLQDPTQDDDAVRLKLSAYRAAVKTVEASLKTARDDLRNYVTLRQEAILINLGYLD
jgi:hypothetical protein